MKARLALVLLAGCDTSLPCTPATPQTIDGHIGEFYQCLDDHTNDGDGCGQEGYALGFGGRYAVRFWDVTRPAASPELATWLGEVGSCLQQALAEVVTTDMSCDEVREVGFGTHAACYLDTGFCALTLEDQLAVLGTIDEADQGLPEVLESMRLVLAGCQEEK